MSVAPMMDWTENSAFMRIFKLSCAHGVQRGTGGLIVLGELAAQLVGH